MGENDSQQPKRLKFGEVRKKRNFRSIKDDFTFLGLRHLRVI
jgi:hypothetical protein